MKHWGIDLGGTKTEIIVIENGRVLIRRRIPTSGREGYPTILQGISTLVRDVSSEVGSSPESIGFGTPGSLDPKTGLLRNSNTTCLNGMALADDLGDILGTEVVLANDANCFALAEARWGVGRRFGPIESLLGLILGTGVGAGFVVHGKPIIGTNGNSGEWGHNPLEHDGVLCYCGRTGCVETVISGPALESHYKSTAGVARTLEEIVERAPFEVAASKTIERLVSGFGRALASVINILDPSVIVVGGGVGKIETLYSRWPEYVLPHIFNGGSGELRTKLTRPLLGDSAGVFGAAALTGDFELEEFAS
jgi:predicted NBD/HSP70 family sugar kinase